MLTKQKVYAKIDFADFRYAPLPQLDRGLGYEPRRRGFESLKARQNRRTPTLVGVLLFCGFLKGGFEPRGGSRRITKVASGKFCRRMVRSRVL